MSRIWLLVAFALVGNTQYLAAKGGESHGGDGFSVGDATKVFDVLEYENEFTPSDLPEYGTVIKAKLDILKAKLPRVGRFFESIFTRGINPRWYLVAYKLKDIADEGPSNLILAFDKIQIAINSGRIVQIQEEMFNRLEPKHKSYLLFHEAIISAIGVELVKNGSQVRSLAALLMHKNLANFPAKEIADEMRAIVSERSSKLYIFAGLDTSAPENPLMPDSWEDHSTLKDGVTSASCLDQADHCVLKNKRSGLYWTHGFAASEGIKNWHDAKAKCFALANWGGFSDWRLPARTELYNFSGQSLAKLLDAFPNFGGIGGTFWSGSKVSSNLARAWIMNTQIGTESNLDTKEGLADFRCVRSDTDAKWINLSRSNDNSSYTECITSTDNCAFKQAATGLIWGRRSSGVDNALTATKYYPDARDLCSTMTWAGANGWRLPTQSEWTAALNDDFMHYLRRFPEEAVGSFYTNFWALTTRTDDTFNRYNHYTYYRVGIEPMTGKLLEINDTKNPGDPIHYQSNAWLCVRPSYPTTGPDADGDGVPDAYDKCPGTPKGKPVYKEGSIPGCVPQ